MRRTASDDLRRFDREPDIFSACQRIQATWSDAERERRAGLAAVRQYALWETISHSPEVVAADRRPLAACKSGRSF